MNCSQLLERKAATNWEKSAFTPQSLEAKLNEIRSESQLWAALRPSPSNERSDRTLPQTPFATPRWG